MDQGTSMNNATHFGTTIEGITFKGRIMENNMKADSYLRAANKKNEISKKAMF